MIDETSFFPSKKQMLVTWTQKPIQVTTNHFNFVFEETQKFNEWHLTFIEHEDFESYLSDPKSVQEAIPADSRGLIMEVKKSNGKELRETLGSNFISGLTLFTVSVENLDSDVYCFKAHPEFVMICKRVHKDIDFVGINNMANEDCRRQLLRFLNANLKRILRQKNYIEWGRNKKYYNMTKKINIDEHNLMIFSGFKTSIDIYEEGIKLLVDCSSRIVRFNNVWEDFLKSNIKSSDHEKICDFFIGMSCMANYGNQRVYRIDDIEFTLTPTSPFPDKKFSTYEDYFVSKYGVGKLRYPAQFLLVHRNRILEFSKGGDKEIRYENVYLVPELMLPCGLTDAMRENFTLMKDLSKYTLKAPQQRFGEIGAMIDSINDFEEKEKIEEAAKRSFKFKVNSKSNTVTGYTLNYPILTNGQTKFTPNKDRIDIKRLADKKNIDNWVFFYDFKNERDLDVVLDNMYESSKRYSLNYKDPNCTLLIPRNPTAETLDQLIRKNKKAGSPTLIFFFVSRSTARFLYKKAKAYFHSKGIASQFFVSFNPKKDVNSLTKYGNILLQMVNKLGGTLWEVECDKKDMIIAGADVYHGAHQNSVISLVSQMGHNFTTFYSLTSKQKKGVQIMNGVYKMVIDAVKYYIQKYGKPPKEFLFFRHGVGEGQYDDVIEFEVNRILETFAVNYKTDAPKLTFVIVNKRVDDRFAVQTKDGLKNPQGGLVVIDDVVKRDRANFFLIAQNVTQGTANPTHYEVLFTSGGLKFEEVVELAYSFTYGYANWMGAVKVPAPVQYAHKLSNLIGIAENDDIEDHLKEVLYYL